MTEARLPLLRESLRLLRPFWRVSAVATALGGVSGLATAALLAAINRGLHAEDEFGWSSTAGLIGLGLLSVLGQAVAGTSNSLVGQKVIAALRKDISARILQAPIAAIEQHRTHRLLATLNNDVEMVSGFTFNVSGYAVAFTVTLGCVAYLILLSPALFALAGIALAGGVALTHRARRVWMQDYATVREAQDELQRQYRAITEGAKELRGHRPRRLRVFFRHLAGAVDGIAERKSHAMRLFWTSNAAASGLFFLAIAALLLLRPRLGLDPAAVSGFVIVLLYVKGPLDQLIGALPAFGQAQVAFRRVAELSAAFQTTEPALLREAGGEPPDFRDGIALRGVRYAYPAVAGGESFVVGPIDLEIETGELVFVVGDNGSGKTTLIKLLLGLYVPQAGEIRLDGRPVTDVTRDDYRQLFTTVFADYYLFDDLIAAEDSLPPEAERYLARLEIAHKLRLMDGRFSTTDLSTGQRKRLALIQAWLEGRPVLVFDEWAADQDPSFRRVFYTELLPELQQAGRTLIVISHDDRYFHVADRLLRMEAGLIVSEDRHRADRPEAQRDPAA